MTLDSEIEIPELPPARGIPDVTIRRSTCARVECVPTMEEEQVFNINCGAFRVVHGREILVNASEGIHPDAVRVMLLGRVMAFLLRQRGWIPLHASGVVIEGQSVLFLGRSGVGKSTTAAAFHSRGHLLITDDVGPVRAVSGRCIVQPGQPRIRLHEDSRPALKDLYLSKRFQLDKDTYDLDVGGSRKPLQVRRIYLLNIGESINIEPLPRVLATAALYRHSFVNLTQSVRAVLAAHLEQCASIATIVPVHRLVRMQSLDALPELVEKVEADLSSD